jgi:C_GCAxxG_C_C family probable redox protein
VAESYNIKSDLIPKIATGFCSGMARTSSVCGAVSGAVMAISLFSGRTAPEDDIRKNYAMVQEFIDRFEKAFTTTSCSKLIDCDLNTPEGQARFVEKNLAQACKSYTQKATQIAMSIIDRA